MPMTYFVFPQPNAKSVYRKILYFNFHNLSFYPKSNDIHPWISIYPTFKAIVNGSSHKRGDGPRLIQLNAWRDVLTDDQPVDWVY